MCSRIRCNLKWIATQNYQIVGVKYNQQDKKTFHEILLIMRSITKFSGATVNKK